MNILRGIIYCSLVLVFVISCSESGPTEPSVKFAGITETDMDGNLIGNVDDTDWEYGYQPSKNKPVVMALLPAYPNPTCNYFNLRFDIVEQDSIKIWIEDGTVEGRTILIDGYYHAGSYNMQFDLLHYEDGSLRKKGIKRIFFQIITKPDYPIFKGDIELY